MCPRNSISDAIMRGVQMPSALATGHASKKMQNACKKIATGFVQLGIPFLLIASYCLPAFYAFSSHTRISTRNLINTILH
jgi:hypothetical protein